MFISVVKFFTTMFLCNCFKQKPISYSHVILKPTLPQVVSLSPTPLIQSKRCLTAPEVSTALRPFYFLVHPDLFGKYPKEQTENEKSLQVLKNYVDTLVHNKQRPNPKEVKFFVKPRGQTIKDKTPLPSIRIRLRDTKLRATVVTILKAAELPTGYVDAIPEKANDDVVKPPEDLFRDDEREDAFYYEEKSKTGFSSTDKNQPVLGWLQTNVDIARQRLSHHEPIRLETERLQGLIITIIKKCNLRLSCRCY